MKEGHKNWETKTKKKSTGLASRNAEIKAKEIGGESNAKKEVVTKLWHSISDKSSDVSIHEAEEVVAVAGEVEAEDDRTRIWITLSVWFI